MNYRKIVYFLEDCRAKTALKKPYDKKTVAQWTTK